LANTLAPQPLLLQPAAVGGVWLLDWGLAATNVLVAKAVERPRYAWCVALLVVCWIGAGWAAVGRETGSLQVAIVQPNALPEFKWHEGGRRRVLDDLEELSSAARESLSAEGPRLLVWPETALPLIVRPGGGAEFWLTRLVEDLNIPLITGMVGTTVENGDELPTNAAVSVVPGQGITGRYDKLHLVPFSEKMPFSDVFPAIKKLNFGQGDYARGDKVVVLPVDGASASVLICFEAILPQLVRAHVRRGGQILVNITNDSWFGNTGACEQHASIALIRSVEHRRWMVRAANTGVSMVVDPWGRVMRRGGLFRTEVLVGSVKARSDLTPYARAGDWAAWLGVIAAVGIVAGVVVRR
jgi:apolipoprotein N-acyltransferase